MAPRYIDLALEMLEKANAQLQSELLTAEDARAQLAKYARAHKLAGFGMAINKTDEDRRAGRLEPSDP